MRKYLGPIAASTVGAAVLGLLLYALAISIGLSAEQKGATLATIATGIALLAVAVFAYRLQRRSLDLEQRNFNATHEPRLGIHWKNPAMYPSTQIAAGEASEVFAEYIMWNAGDVPILIWQPSLVIDRRLGKPELGGGRTVIERLEGGQVTHEKAFPIVIGKGETCVWRQYTGDTTMLRPLLGEVIEASREIATTKLLAMEGSRRFLFEVLYFSRPPAEVTHSDVQKQYVGFAYQISEKLGNQ